VMRRHLNRYLAPADSQWLAKQDALIRARLTDEEFRSYLQGFQSMTGLASTVFSMDTPALGRKFALPVFLVQGAEDHITDATASKGYFDNIQAPIKRLTLIEGAGHFALTTHTERVGEAIREDLRLVRQLNK
jgi:pimeloyl-ACP methyl ester carboxylesterase